MGFLSPACFDWEASSSGHLVVVFIVDDDRSVRFCLLLCLGFVCPYDFFHTGCVALGFRLIWYSCNTYVTGSIKKVLSNQICNFLVRESSCSTQLTTISGQIHCYSGHYLLFLVSVLLL